ncbi:MAG: hypothetical protein KatS3mg089_0890 [Patescibacteria group bacterium]|nr:MAG: hypothetical protein KatS3mg089_0890 [Patescibacteria group bacterium]
MKRTVLIASIGFIGGFLLHSLFLPDFLTNGVIFLPRAPVQSIQKDRINDSEQTDPLLTKIAFNGSSFERTNVTIESSRYIAIVNMSENETMDLRSDLANLQTPRPYGYGEELRTRLDKKGQFLIWSAKNPQVRMLVTVR